MKLKYNWLWPMAIATLLLAPASRSFAKDLTLLKGTDVALAFDQALNSKSARAGDKVALHVSEDVIVNGHTVIREGTKVNAIVSSVEKRKNFGINAKMRLAFDPVQSVTGQTVSIEPRDKGKIVGGRTAKAGAAAGGGAFLLGPVGLVGGYFVVGKQVQINPGDKIVSEVAYDTTITFR